MNADTRRTALSDRGDTDLGFAFSTDTRSHALEIDQRDVTIRPPTVCIGSRF